MTREYLGPIPIRDKKRTLLARIKRALTNELRRKEYRDEENPLTGHCYVASEVLFHALGGKQAGWHPVFLYHEEQPHWYLENDDGTVLDFTSSQFDTPPPYGTGVRRGFLTKRPSKRAREVLKRIGVYTP